jgi:hypothetical protein
MKSDKQRQVIEGPLSTKEFGDNCFSHVFTSLLHRVLQEVLSHIYKISDVSVTLFEPD